MKWVIIFSTFLICPRTSNSVDEYAFQGKERSARFLESQSLAKLLRYIVREYLSDCALDIIYDSNGKQDYSRDFGLHSVVGLSYTQKTIDITSDGFTVAEQSPQMCSNHVVFLQNISSIKHVMRQNMKSKIVVVSEESPWAVQDFFKNPLSRSYMNLLVISRSSSSRTGVGSYVLYTHKLYTEGSGTPEPLLLMSWLNDSVEVQNIDLFPKKLKEGFMSQRLLTSVVENPPFTIKKSTLGSDEFQWDGLEIRILKLAAAHLNFTVEFIKPRSTATCPVEAAKNDVLLGISSAAIGGIYQTSDVNEFFDTTRPHAADCAAFISLASTALPKYQAILGPFQPTVWLLLCLSYFILIVPLSFNSNYTIMSLIKHPKGLNHMFWFVFSTYTNSFVIKNPLLDYGLAKNSISILLGIYWVFTIIVTACYTGSIVSFISLPAYPTAIETAEDLLYYRYRIGTLDHNGWEKWFNVNTTDDPFLKKLLQKVEYVPSVLEGVQNASRAYFWPYAFLASRTSLDYFIQTDFAPTWTTKRTLMHISKECFVRYNVVQLYALKSLFTESIDNFIFRCTEAGLIDKIVADLDWEVQRVAMRMNKQITKGMPQKVQVEERTLSVEDTQGMFLLLGIGFLLALLALSCESLSNWLKRRKRRGR